MNLFFHSFLSQKWRQVGRNTAYILAGLLLFLFSLDLMIVSLHALGRFSANIIFEATSNPYTAFFIGLIVSAILQSSSVTTSMVVALVASSSLSIQSAIPIVMGANIGTTITASIISLSFITRKKDFRRAVIMSSVHNFFNILTALILFPLEHYYGFLSTCSLWLASFFSSSTTTSTTNTTLGLPVAEYVHSLIESVVNGADQGYISAFLSIVLLYSSIIFFRKIISQSLGFDNMKSILFRHKFKSFLWGLFTTSLIRSSTVTTCLMTIMAGHKMIKIRQAVPFIYGANIGTTITALIAAYTHSGLAISIALVHFLFNTLGAFIFMTIPYAQTLHIQLARELGRVVYVNRLIWLLYLLLTFFLVPFALIYISKLFGG